MPLGWGGVILSRPNPVHAGGAETAWRPESRLSAVRQLCRHRSSPGALTRSDASAGPTTNTELLRGLGDRAQGPAATRALFPRGGSTPLPIWEQLQFQWLDRTAHLKDGQGGRAGVCTFGETFTLN